MATQQMPSKRARKEPRAVGKPPIAPGPDVGGDGRGLPLPHERDESTQSTDPRPQAVMKQALKDLQSGQVDTDMRATPGLDAQRREKLVPRGG